MKKILTPIAFAALLISCSTQKNALYQRKGFFETTQKGYVFKPVSKWEPYTPHNKTDVVYQYALTNSIKKLK